MSEDNEIIDLNSVRERLKQFKISHCGINLEYLRQQYLPRFSSTSNRYSTENYTPDDDMSMDCSSKQKELYRDKDKASKHIESLKKKHLEQMYLYKMQMSSISKNPKITECDNSLFKF